MRLNQHQRSFGTALAVSVVAHTAGVSLWLITRNVDDSSLPSRSLEVLLTPQRVAATLPPSPEHVERSTSRELSRQSQQQELKVDSAPKSMPGPEATPVLALPLPSDVSVAKPVANAAPVRQQPRAEVSTRLPESTSAAAAAPATREAAVADNSAYPGASDDAGIRLPPRITHWDLHKDDPVTVTGPVFPGHADDAGIRLPPRITHWDLHKDDPVTVTGPVIPGHTDDAGIRLPPRVTYADLVGKKKADEACAGCHGPEGRKPSTPEAPRLAGLKNDYLVQTLIEYRKGARDNALMSAAAKSLTDNEIRDLAWYYARRR